MAGCGTSSLEMSRSAATVAVPQPPAVSALSRKFRAEVPYFVNFGFNADVLDPEARARLDRQAVWIIAHPTTMLRIYGHTDRVGSAAYNEDLGMRRAERVVAYLVSRGIDAGRLEAVVSYGEDLPLVDTEERERMNRRVLTDVVGILPVNGPHDDEPRLSSRLIIDAIPPIDDNEVSDPPSEQVAASTVADTGTGGNPNAGRGNGDEVGDPGNSGGKNNGGDEL